MPRTLDRGPDYNLDVKTRVPTGQIQRTDVIGAQPINDNPLIGLADFVGGLAKVGYNIKNIFNQNNESNRVKGWDELVPDAQRDWNTLETKSLDQLDEENKLLLGRYTDTIRESDYSKKVQDLIISDLNNYSEKKMEQLLKKSVSENEITNVNNFNLEYQAAINNEDLGEVERLLKNASTGEDAWMRQDTAEIYRIQAGPRINFQIAKNDLAEMDYKTAFDTLQATAVDEDGNPLKDENGDLVYLFSPELSNSERATLNKTVTQAGTIEEQRKSLAKYEAKNASLNSLYANETSIADFMSSKDTGLDTTEKIAIVNTYEAQQRLEVARLDSIASEPLWKKIVDLDITDPQVIRDIDNPNLSEKTRKQMVDYLESKIPTVKPGDPFKKAQVSSAARLRELKRRLGQGDEVFSLLRSAQRLTGVFNDDDFSLLLPKDYDAFLEDAQNKSALTKLTSIISGASRDKRFIDEDTGLQDQDMFNEFSRQYIDIFYNQINEEDPEKQMDIDEFRGLASSLIDTITDETLQEDFRKVSISNQTVGKGLGSGFGINKMEVAVTSLNEGQYDAMKYIEPEAWSLFKRKMVEQYEHMTGESYNRELRLYKDKIPIFTNDKGEEVMLIIEGKRPQVVSLEVGLNKHKNLALGYSVGDRNAEDETMLSSGWLFISDKTVDVFGSVYGGQVIRPKGEEEFYIMVKTLRGVDVRPFHGNAESEADIGAAVKEVNNPTIDLNIEDEVANDVDKAIINSTPRSYYDISGIPLPRDPAVPLTPQQRAQDALKRGRP